MSIHPLAAISPDAHVGVGVKIAAFATVEADVELGDFCTVASGAVVKSGVTTGCHNEIGEHAVIGGAPQHVARPEQIGRVVIGDHNVFREHVTVHRALKPGNTTVVGDNNYVMASGHIGHDARVGNNCICANGSMLGGHVLVEDRAFVSGAVAVHQFCRIGSHSITSIGTVVLQDIPPFVTASGNTAAPYGINSEGLKRRSFSADAIMRIKRAYKVLYKSGLGVDDAKREIIAMTLECPQLQMLVDFLGVSTRGIIR